MKEHVLFKNYEERLERSLHLCMFFLVPAEGGFQLMDCAPIVAHQGCSYIDYGRSPGTSCTCGYSGCNNSSDGHKHAGPIIDAYFSSAVRHQAFKFHGHLANRLNSYLAIGFASFIVSRKKSDWYSFQFCTTKIYNTLLSIVTLTCFGTNMD